jgi:hypothetical protein
MSRKRTSNAPVCMHCAAIFPNEWPRDRVLDSGTLTPVNAARLVLVFTRIQYGTRLDELHDECLVDCINWLRGLRAASRSLRVISVERPLFDLYTSQLHAAREAIQRELRERPESDEPDPGELRRGVRSAMDHVGWETFGLSIDPADKRVRIIFTADQDADRVHRTNAFQRELREILGADLADELEIRFQLLDD